MISRRRVASWPELWRFSRVSPACARLARAVVRAQFELFRSDERRWITRIEAEREILQVSDSEIEIVDCAAGSPERGGRPTVTRKVGEMCRSSSKSRRWASLLFRLVRDIRAVNLLEMGTCMGISAAYQAAALALNGKGRLVTLEGSESLAGIARDMFQRLGLGNVEVIVGCFQETLAEVLNGAGAPDYVFIDGHHQEEPTLEYFSRVICSTAPGALLVFDDIGWSDGMRRAWKKIESDQRVQATLDLGTLGLCIVGSPVRTRRCFSAAL